MSKPIFHIENLKCQYPGALHPVLEIAHFTIFRGELVFFLGVSGVGKSTLIESLGLMNHTIVKSDNAKLDFYDSQGKTALFDLWNHGPQELAEFRAQQFSFIFQSSNLFEKLSLEANAIMPALAHEGDTAKTAAEAKHLAAKLLSNVSSEDYIKKSAGAISGGQKQRLAFIQAIISSHQVLFGDEPTGNLDWGNAKKVMTTLKHHIHANQKTGLVVSHDIELSVAFADRIVLLTGRTMASQPGRMIGEILPENIYTRDDNGWTNSNGKLSHDNLISFLKQHFENHAS